MSIFLFTFLLKTCAGAKPLGMDLVFIGLANDINTI